MPPMTRNLSLVAVLPLLLLAGCKSGDKVADEAYSCPAILHYEYREPVLTIQSATGANGQAVPNLVLGDFKLDGQPRTAAVAAGQENGKDGATESNGVLNCTVTCGFGTESGVYEFTVAAPGYVTQTVSTRAGYSVMSGISDSPGCSSGTAFDGGTRIQLMVQAQPSQQSPRSG